MQQTDDSTLLRQYAENHCDEAFASLVTRHVNLVYSVALRHVGNPHNAEEIAQAVFIILAKKAAQLRHDKALSSWLFQATRLTANNFVRSETRRHRRDQEAHMQSILNESGSEVWPRIAPWLDTAVAGLREKDRQAIVLRFYEGRNLREVGLVLGASEDAAEKRVNRALEKLRTFFKKRGVSSTTAIIAGTISANSIQTAPAALAKSVTAVAIAKGAMAGGSALTLAKATLITMKTKTIVATIAATVVVLGTGAYLLTQAKTHPPSAPDDAAPIKLANDAFIARGGYIEGIAVHGLQNGSSYNDDRFSNDVAPDTRRTTNSLPAGHIKSLITSTASGSDDYLASVSSRDSRPLQSARYTRYDVTKHSVLLGKRIRGSGWIKTKDVANWAGAALAIINSDGHVFASDAMTDRPIRGTTDWQPIEIVTDVPSEPCTIYFGPMLYGAGEVWCDDFQINVIPSDTPITDDRIWHVWSANPNDYSETTDYNNTHDGHPTFCITYTPPGAAPQGSWMWWGEDIRNPDKYLGHTVRMTVWIKTESVSDDVRPNLRPKGPNFKLLAQDKMAGSRITGTTDWTQRTITCVIPKGTQCLDTGFAFSGSGKVWIDMDSLKYEIVK